MDEIERLLNQAEPYLAEAETRTRQALNIPYLPEYMGERLRRLEFLVGRNLQDAKGMISKVREHIPQDAVEAERHSGRQQGFDLEVKPCVISERSDFMEALNKGIKL